MIVCWWGAQPAVRPGEDPRAGAQERRAHRRRVAVRCAAAHLRVPARRVRLGHEASGRPLVLVDGAPSDLAVSVSGAGSRVVVATGLVSRLGVDAEWLDRDLDVDLMARQFLPSPEQDAVAAAGDETARRAAFLELWTWKEAVLKARGTGLQAPLPHRGPDAPDGTLHRPEPGFVVTVVSDPEPVPVRWSHVPHLDPVPPVAVPPVVPPPVVPPEVHP